MSFERFCNSPANGATTEQGTGPKGEPKGPPALARRTRSEVSPACEAGRTRVCEERRCAIAFFSTCTDRCLAGFVRFFARIFLAGRFIV